MHFLTPPLHPTRPRALYALCALCALLALSSLGCALTGELRALDPRPPGVAVGERAGLAALSARAEATWRAWYAAAEAAYPGHLAAALPADVSDLGAWYAAAPAPLFTDRDGRATPLGDATARLVADVNDHGLSLPALSLPALSLPPAQPAQPAQPPARLTDAQRLDLLAFARDVGGPPSAAALRARLLRGAELWAPWLAPLEGSHRRVAAAAHAEAAYAAAFARYALALRLRARANCPTLAPWLPLLDDPTAARVRLLSLLDALAASPPATPEDALAAAQHLLWPAHPQYAKLLDARRRYAAFAAAGGWPTLPPATTSATKRRPSPAIAALKQRLALEGYLPPDALNDTWDDALSDALLRYQRAHQLKEDGLITDPLLRSLNTPAAARVTRLDVALSQYRDALVGAFSYYVLVNIPDFHVEVWRDGLLERRHKVVVGNNAKARRAKPLQPPPGVPPSDDDLYTFPNRTPTQLAWMKYVIYNPFWNVPLRIQLREVEPKRARNPAWFDKSGFEYVTTSSGRTLLRQRPGPDNALGQVKLIFPNPHNTYLHDTNARAYFKYPKRAFSHGCMRVQDPLLLAQHLLTHDGQFHKRKVQELLEADPLEETSIALRRPIPVHVAYFIARVDDDGTTHFLDDIYNRARAQLASHTPPLPPPPPAPPPPVPPPAPSGDEPPR